jgi:type IV pilus assembly protein PilY1
MLITSNHLRRLVCSLLTATLLLVFAPAGHTDDTDVYLNPNLGGGAEPLVMFALDYRPNLTATVCNGNECDSLIAEGYLPATGPYNFFQLLRAVLKKVLDPLGGVRIGFMLSHGDSCSGTTTAGPGVTNCSNGGYILHGFSSMGPGTDDGDTYQVTGEDANKLALFARLDAIPDPTGNLSHAFQGKELYFELFRYLTGQGIYNGHLGYKDFGDNTASTNLDVDFPPIQWDTSIENGGNYTSPLEAVGNCSKVFVINLLFQVSSQEDDSDDAITETKANGGMGGINLSGRNNSFDTVIEYMKDADLGDDTYGAVSDLEGQQNVVSYFLVDPTKINTKTNGYATAGGTGNALELSDDPTELIQTLSNIFRSILSVSTTFVAPSVPVNVFNRSQVLNEVFMALFEAEKNGFPRWSGNLKKLRVALNPISGEPELQDADGVNAIDIDGRIRRDALTFWTDGGTLPAPVDDEVSGKDGRAVERGGAGQQIPGFVGGSPGASNGDAGARTLLTEDGLGGLMPLNADPATVDVLWSEITADWSPAATSPTQAGATADERARALNVLRYARGLEDDGTTTRAWLMGDPLHSRPRPINYGARGAYTVDNPDIRVLVGANDGFLRMVRNTDATGAEDGSEDWAFVPRAVIPIFDRLRRNLAGTPVHPIGTDASPVVYTLDINNDGNLDSADGDVVYAFFGLRRGGKALYGLDISNPDAPSLLWSIGKGASGTDFAQLAQTWSVPTTGHVMVDGNIIPVLVFGGGYNGDDGGDNLGDLGKDAKNRSTAANTTPAVGVDDDEGNAIFIVNALDGSLVWKAAYGATAGYNAAGKVQSVPTMVDSFAANVAAVDTTGDGLLDRIYAADTGGIVWRIDLVGLVDDDNDSNTPEILLKDRRDAWSVHRLISVGRHVAGYTGIEDDRRFFNTPDLARSRDGIGPFDAVIIGSGDREDPNGDDVDNYFYVFKDRYVTSGYPPPSTLEHADLADLTSNCLQDDSCGTDPDLTNGWRISLTNDGEKALADAVTIGGHIFFTTFAPTPATATCTLNEGDGRLYVVSIRDATAVMNFDTTNDGNDAGAETLERADRLGSGGIPVQVVPLNQGYVLVQGQETGENLMKVSVLTGIKTYWSESYR